MNEQVTKARAKLSEFEARARDARDAWIADHLKGTKVETRVRELLKDRLEKIIFETLGLRSDGWGRLEWEIHRTNGRTSPLYVEVDQRARVAAIEMVAEALKQPPVLTKAMRDAIRKSYLDQVSWRARELAREEGDRASVAALDRVLDELDENDKPFCSVCRVNHLEPLHDADVAVS